jgi:hypothetical protein
MPLEPRVGAAAAESFCAKAAAHQKILTSATGQRTEFLIMLSE